MGIPPNQESTQDTLYPRDLKTHGFAQTISVAEAWHRINAAFSFTELGTEQVSLSESLGRVLAEDIISSENVPSRNRSAVDGYAIRSEDSHGSSIANPRELTVIGDLRIEMDIKPYSLDENQAIKVATGSGIPKQADAVMMVEDTNLRDTKILEIFRPVSKNANIILEGTDIAKGQTVLSKGRVIQPPDLGLLKTLGYQHLNVIKKPRIATIAIGDELTNTFSPLKPGEIRETNRLVLGGYIIQNGGEWIDLGIVSDNKDQIIKTIKKGLETADLVCTTGGTSVGQRDFSVDAAASVGKILFHGVSMSPGMPIAVTSVKNKPIVSLAGFSVSAIVEFHTFVIPMIRKYLGINPNWLHPQQDACLIRPIPSRQGRQTFVRVRVFKNEEDDTIYAEPIRVKGSSILSSMVRANGYLILQPELEGISENTTIRVSMIGPIE